MVKVRMAPSPTGFLHLGTARTALFNWLFARHHGGEFILRLEDTDLERSEKKFEDDILSGLKWLGIDWDNKDIIRQTERIDIYEAQLKKLLSESRAFYCHHTREELEEESKHQMTAKLAPRHVCEHKNTDLGKTPGGIIRLRINDKSEDKISFDDKIRGLIEWDEKLLGDFSLAKNLRSPLYNFAVVVDDIDMKITDVIRGEDHISNTPKQILIYKALGAEIPNFAHLPLILGEDRSKMSKRHGATSISEYMPDYLPEALVNFLGQLGLTYSEEILSKEDMAKEFNLAKVHKSGAVFDVKKLNWTNSQYVKKLSINNLRSLSGISKIPESALSIITERLEKLSQTKDFEYLWEDISYEGESLIWKKSDKDKTRKALGLFLDLITEVSDPSVLKEKMDTMADLEFSGDKGSIYWPVRVALSGRDKSPDPVSLFIVLGLDKSKSRIKEAIDKIS